MTIEERFWAKVDKSGDCWLWKAHVDPKGYGRFWGAGRMIFAYRWAYESAIGPVPEGLQLDHLCRVRRCVNPAHLEPVTCRENLLRGAGPEETRRRAAQVTHCPRGHAYDEANTHWYRTRYGGWGRTCRACGRERSRRRWADR